MRRCLTLLVLVASVTAHAQLTSQETQGITDALFVGNLRLTDLQFARKPFTDPYRMPTVDLAIDDPLKSANALMMLHAQTADASPAQLLAVCMLAIDQESIGAIQHDPPFSGLDQLPVGLRAPILGLVNWINSANNEIRRATEKLTQEEKRLLIESLPVWAVEQPTVSYSFVRSQTADQKKILELLSKVDLDAIKTAGTRLAEAVERVIEQLKQSTDEVATFKTRVGGIPIVVGGRGNDVHSDTDALLSIDLGGDDHYVGRHGAGVGYASVLIDLNGNDTYECGDLNVGAGVLGVGLAYDEGGNDVFRGQGITFGAGLAGVGVLSKKGGEDHYSSTTLAQGFAVFGIGLLVDTGGKDTYDAQLFAQGASRTQGVGWLVDKSGDDQYRAGGLILNSPLFATAHYSFAQGFSMGYREDTGGLSGGVGLITDLQGDDFYQGETYQQAASYWFALGSLFDAQGNDTYSGYHYCQSSAMHACAAYLFDLQGDDSYIVKVGAAHAIGHDYGVAFLLDRAGDDVYASRDSTPGIGNANGLGIFVDADGIDRYYGPPGKGNPARGTGSLGVFADLNGTDDYRYGLADAQSRTSEAWGVALDRPTVATDSTPTTQRDPVKPNSEPMPSEAEMTAIYRKAAQWNVGTAQSEVADNLDRLVKIGTPALQWMLDNRLATADHLQLRAFVHVVQILGQDAATALGAKAFRATDQELVSLIRIATDANVSDFAALLPGFLKKPVLQDAAIAAAGALKARSAVPDLMSLCRNEDRLKARAAMVALMQIADPASAATAQAMLFNDDLMTRKAAMKLLATFPSEALAVADAQAKSSDEFRTRIAIELYGTIATNALATGGATGTTGATGATGTTGATLADQALEKIGALLLDPRPGVRIECLVRLNGRCPDKYRADFLSLRNDPVPSVRSVAAAVDP